MMKVRKSLLYLFITISTFLFSCLIVDASGSVSTSMSGSNSVYVGNNVDITLTVTSLNGVDGGLTGFGGKIVYDSSYLEFVSFKSLAPFEIGYNSSSHIFTGFDPTGGSNKITGYRDMIRITFRTKAVGNTTVRYTETDASDINSNAPSVNGVSKTISITNPPSSNANLSTLSVSGASINFNPNTTSYSVKVGRDVSSVDVNASAQDGGARVSGTGNKSLNYGSNTISVTVTAPSGATKTYTINVTREDPRSSNANLSSLKVDGGSLSPSFNKNTTVYEVSVPFSVETLNVKAVAEDGKAKVSVSGNEGLISEGTKDVTVTVVAENGSKKSYVIKVTRGKDPNKVLDTNNYLSSLTASVGMLSPVFDREKTNYIVYLPFEVEQIEFNAVVEDTKYAVLTKDGPDKLSVGSNKYTFTVTAENNSTKVYTIIVMRGASLDGEEISSNVLLKDLKVVNGSFDKPFDSKVNVYRYNKKKGFKFDPIPEDDKTKVTVIEQDGVVSIILEASGDFNVYTLIPEDESNLGIFIAMAIGSGALVVGGSFVGFKLGLKKMPKSKLSKNFTDESKDMKKDFSKSDSKPLNDDEKVEVPSPDIVLEDKNPFLKQDNSNENKFIRKF